MEHLTPLGYIPRLVDREISDLLETFGAVEINGPKWCGKTWTALNHSKSLINLDDADNRILAKTDPLLVLMGDHPHLIDEWQLVPSVRDAVRRSIDISGNTPGMFLLTGSSAPHREEVTHSGAGRISTIRMRPMSLSESGFSNASISLEGLFAGEFEPQQLDVHLDTIAEMIVKGGWPASLSRSRKQYSRLPYQYLQAIYDFTAPSFGKSPEVTRKLLQALVRNEGDAVSYATLATDIAGGEKPIDQTTVRDHLDFLKSIYLIEELQGWDAPVRSRARVRTRPKRHFVDPSLGAAILGVSPEALLGDFQLFGRLFESMCMRDLRVYLSASSQTTYCELRHYRDDYGLEIDVIIELSDRRWAAIEIKLSEDKVSQAVNSLLRLKQKVSENPLARNKEPEFLAVLVGRTPYARRTPEGVYIIPITCLTA